LPQTPCQLCGISFKIARIRTQSEPREAAWDISPLNPAVPDEGECWKPGCKVVTRPRDPAALDETVDDDDLFEDVIPSGVDSEGNEVSLRAYMALEGWDPEEFDDFDEEAMDGIGLKTAGTTGSGTLRRSRTAGSILFLHLMLACTIQSRISSSTLPAWTVDINMGTTGTQFPWRK
jgi:hypothetical protein